VLAAVATLYLAALSFRPDLVAALSPPGQRTAAETNEGQRQLTDSLAQAQSLRDRIAALDRDLQQARAALEAEREQVVALRTKLATYEERAQKPFAVVEVKPPQPRLTAAQRAAEARAAATATKEAAVGAAAPIETSSIAAKPAIINAGAAGAEITGAARPVAPPAPVALNLGGGPSLDALRLSWSLLSERHASVLRSLAPRYVGGGTDDSPYQLIAGPVATTAEAERLCTALKARRIACTVAALKGDAL
jgi:hypothetical protein